MEASCPMMIRFETLGTPAQMKRAMEYRCTAQRFWALFLESGLASAQSFLRHQSLPLEVSVGDDDVLAVLTEERSLAPLAQLWCEEAPSGIEVHLGRAAGSYEYALAQARKIDGIDLSTSRVRAGFTRGHLLEVVVSIPFDVVGDDESLQIAAEVFLEHYIGEQLLDQWVANVSVSRIARTRGLLVVSEHRESAESHSLREFKPMLERAVAGVLAQVPASRVLAPEAEEQWTALEIPEMAGGLLPDRRFASTCLPEALKAALEGLPFSSSRFTQGPELFCWLAWNGEPNMERRIALRERVEGVLNLQHGVALCGTGFGLRRDFVDLWLMPDEQTIRSVGEQIRQIVGSCELGFFDETLRRETLYF